MTLLKLFWSFFQIGLLSFGGGYAAMPLILEQVVTRNQWLTMAEFADIVTIAEMTPGPIAVNSATFVGLKIAGLPGALISTLGCILPACVILMILAYFYYKYRNLAMVQGVLSCLRPAVVALIASAVLSILLLACFRDGSLPKALEDVNWLGVVLFGGALGILQWKKPSPVIVMAGAGLLGMLLYQFFPGV